MLLNPAVFFISLVFSIYWPVLLSMVLLLATGIYITSVRCPVKGGPALGRIGIGPSDPMRCTECGRSALMVGLPLTRSGSRQTSLEPRMHQTRHPCSVRWLAQLAVIASCGVGCASSGRTPEVRRVPPPPETAVAVATKPSPVGPGSEDEAMTVKRILQESTDGLETGGLFYDDRIAPAYQSQKFAPLLSLVGPDGFVLSAPDKTPPLSMCSAELGEPIELCARALHAALRAFREQLDLPPGPYRAPPRFEEDASTIRVIFDQDFYTMEFSKEPLAFTRLGLRSGRSGVTEDLQRTF